MRDRQRMSGLALVALLLASACTQGTPGASPQGTPGASPSGATSDATVTIAMPIVSSFRQLDPHDAAGSTTGLLNNMYEQLIFLEQGTLEAKPRLAESWQADGNRYTFKLRRGVKFHDGNEMTSADVKLSVERMLAIKKAFGYQNLQVIQKMETPDDYTITFTAASGGAPFVKVVSQVSIISGKEVQARTVSGDNASAWFRDKADGTGPYKLQQWTPGDRLVLLRNDAYWGTKPYFKTAIVLTVPEANTEALMIQRGEADVALQVPPDSIDQLAADANLQVLQQKGPYNTSLPLFIVGDIPTADVNVRRALSYAMNYDELYKVRGKDFYPTDGPVPSAFMNGYVPPTLYKYDLAKAKDALSKSAYPNGGFTVTFVATTAIPEQQAALEILQRELKSLNVTMNIQVRDFVPVYQDFLRWKAENDPKAKRAIHGQLVGIPPIVPDAYNYLTLYLCDNSLDFNAYCNSTVESTIRQGSAATTPEQRDTLYKRAIEMILADAPQIYMGISRMAGVARKTIKGFQLDYLWHPYGIDIARLSK